MIITFFGNATVKKKLGSPCYMLWWDNAAHIKYIILRERNVCNQNAPL